MGHIIRLHGDEHRDIQSLLPWYVTGRLDALEHAQVEAHLGTCPECQAELRFERGLDAEIAGLPVDIEQGWSALKHRMEGEPRKRGASAIGAWLAAARREAGRKWRVGAPWLGWVLAAQIVLLLLVGALLWPSQPPARYHALGAPPANIAGNVVVIFRPDTSERAMREALKANHARLVDGPTAADAYVLHVPAPERAATLERLRGRGEVVLAEPVDSGASP
jgi:hypothetical protein